MEGGALMALSFMRDNVQLDMFQIGLGATLEPQAHWQPPRGIAPALSVDQLPLEYCSELVNWIPTDGRLEPRPDVAIVGTAASSDLVTATEYVHTDGTSYLVRWTATGMQRWNGSSWSAVSGVTLTGTTSDLICFTVFGGKLLFSNGIGADGMWAVDVPAGTGSKITGAPACRHLTTFNSRVIASAISGQPNTIQWSVKNSYTDWSGTGSGEDDLISTPGGTVDQQFGVHPVTDQTAFVVRSNSIWTMVETGDFDAPFTFARQYAGVGSTSRFGVVAIPGGICLLGRDGVKELLLGSAPDPIGVLVDNQILSDVVDFDKCFMVYLSRRDEIVLKVSSDSQSTKLYRYSRPQKSWTTLQYQFPTQSIALGRFSSAVSFDSLSGTFDELQGTFDGLGSAAGRAGILFCGSGSFRNVVVEAYDGTGTPDLDSVGASATPVYRAQTTLIKSPDDMHCVGLQYVYLTYIANSGGTVTMECTTDDGQTWRSYGSVTLPISGAPRAQNIRLNIEAERLMLRVKTSNKVRIVGLVPHVRAGRPIGLGL